MPGVEFNSPPLGMEDTINSHIQPYINQIPEGKHGGIFGVITDDGNGNRISNAVLAIRVNDKMEIGGYIAKKWGTNPIVYGTEVKFYF